MIPRNRLRLFFEKIFPKEVKHLIGGEPATNIHFHTKSCKYIVPISFITKEQDDIKD
jgi:hypothetical protein